MSELKLAKRPDRTPVKITIALNPDLNQALRDYAAIYHAKYGEAESVAELVPFMLGLCGPGRSDAHARVEQALARSDLATAVLIAAVHTLAMMLAGLVMAWAVYRYLGLRFLRRAWFNLDLAWAVSLVLAGATGLWMAV